MTGPEIALLCGALGYIIGLVAGMLWERERAEGVRKAAEGDT